MNGSREDAKEALFAASREIVLCCLRHLGAFSLFREDGVDAAATASLCGRGSVRLRFRAGRGRGRGRRIVGGGRRRPMGRCLPFRSCSRCASVRVPRVGGLRPCRSAAAPILAQPGRKACENGAARGGQAAGVRNPSNRLMTTLSENFVSNSLGWMKSSANQGKRVLSKLSRSQSSAVRTSAKRTASGWWTR